MGCLALSRIVRSILLTQQQKQARSALTIIRYTIATIDSKMSEDIFGCWNNVASATQWLGQLFDFNQLERCQKGYSGSQRLQNHASNDISTKHRVVLMEHLRLLLEDGSVL